MDPLRRTFVPIALVVLAGVACTEGNSRSSGGPTVDATPNGSTMIEPGHFAYDFAGVEATFVMEGHSATLTIHNGAGTRIGPPRIVVIDQKNQHVQGTIAGAKPIADGADATLSVTFPDAIDQATVGLIQISFGDVAYGLLKPA